MSETPDRLTILEMEYNLVSARLATVNAELALLNKRVESIDTRLATLATIDDRTTSTDRMVTEIARHLGLADS